MRRKGPGFPESGRRSPDFRIRRLYTSSRMRFSIPLLFFKMPEVYILTMERTGPRSLDDILLLLWTRNEIGRGHCRQVVRSSFADRARGKRAFLLEGERERMKQIMTWKMYEQGLLQELRMVSYDPGKGVLTDEDLAAAMTVNENLKSLGFVLKPADLAALALSPSLEGFFEKVRGLMGAVKAKPMYPGFPAQVMEMSEAKFRLHQLIHYFSTYGIESLTGLPVSRGWLPYEGETFDGETDQALLEAKVLELVPEKDIYIRPMEIYFSRRQRMIDKEKDLVLYAAARIEPTLAAGLTVRFKENLEEIFLMILDGCDRNTALAILSALCQHTGDVFRCLEHVLAARDWHLKTGEKRFFVRLLETFPAGDFEENLVYSMHRSEKTLAALERLDYARFSNSPAHLAALNALRDGELRSWFARLEALLEKKDPKALSMLAGRPGLMIRSLGRLLRLGYGQEEILEALRPGAGSLSVQTLMAAIGKLQEILDGKAPSEKDLDIQRAKIRAGEDLVLEAEEEIFDLTGGHADWASREEVMGPFLLKYRADLEERVRKIDEDLVRMERSASGQEAEGLEEELLALEEEEEYLRKHGRSALQEISWDIGDREAVGRKELSRRRRLALIERTRPILIERKEKILSVLASPERLRALAEEELRDRIRKIGLPERKAALKEEKKRLDHMSAAWKRRETAGPVRDLLLAALEERLKKAGAVFAGKKVFVDLGALDLSRSEVRTGDRSQEGGYVRSGLAYKIPEFIGAVRFFVYWNDSKRVDVDLHASAVDLEGENFTIGWNSGFRDGGIVFSGDITHSDAAEFIDVDMGAPVREVALNIHLFSGRPTFAEVKECYVGMMAVSKFGKPLAHYDPRNCFFTHFLETPVRNIQYGRLRVQDRCMIFEGDTAESMNWYTGGRKSAHPVSLARYLEMLFAGKDVTLAESREEADLVLVLGHPAEPQEISLLDHNFFMEE